RLLCGCDIWWLARQADKGLATADDLLSGNGQEPMRSLRRGGKARDPVISHGHAARLRQPEVPALGGDGVKRTGKVPARPFVRRRLVQPVRFGERMVLDVAEI